MCMYNKPARLISYCCPPTHRTGTMPTFLPRCFFDITINGTPVGRVVFELFVNVSPTTCENFRCLCTGEKGEGRTTFKPLHYKGTPIHRIVKGFIIQGGDFSEGNGTGGEAIYGGNFKDEQFQLKHSEPFLLSMANKGPNTNGSQFFITTRPAPHLDGLHVVFGHVVTGKEYVIAIENQKVDVNHRPYADVRIQNCGELVLMKRGKVVGSMTVRESEDEDSEDDSSGSSSSSERASEEERRRKRREKKRRRKRKERKARKREKLKNEKESSKRSKKKRKKKEVESSLSESASDSGEEEGEEDADDAAVVSSTVNEEDIPPDISTGRPSWLYRRSKTPTPPPGEKLRSYPAVKLENRAKTVSESGRRLKGRGVMRFRTPPRFGRSSDWIPERGMRDGSKSPVRRGRSPEYRRRRDERWRETEREGEGERERGREGERERGREGERERGDSERESQRDRDRKRRSKDSYDRKRRREREREGEEGHRRRRQVSSDSEEGRRGHSKERDDRKSRSPSPDNHDKKRHRKASGDQDQSKHRTSHDSRRNRRSPRRGRSGDEERSSDTGGEELLPSKWSRHRDSADSDSSSNEEAVREQQETETEQKDDVFGIDKLLPVN